MNRKERRAASKRSIAAPNGAEGLDEMLAQARHHYQQGALTTAESLCKRILTRESAHVPALNLAAVIAQSAGRHRVAAKMFAQAIALDPLNAACHFNLASSSQLIGEHQEALEHFKQAIALGLSGKNVEDFIVQNQAIAACLDRLETKWPMPVADAELFGAGTLRILADDLFLRCALQSAPLRGKMLEILLTRVRCALLRIAAASEAEFPDDNGSYVACLGALAEQCFLNEYIYEQTDEESCLALRLRELLLTQSANGGPVSPLTLVAVAAYQPLHTLPNAEALLSSKWAETVAGLVRQQLREPLQERRECKAISALTRIEDTVSLQVMQQYEENPYPRWAVDPVATAASVLQDDTDGAAPQDILIAGCGTGRHLFHTSWRFPEATVLAIDISLPSLAYAQRKIREAGLNRVEFAQADIIKIGTIGRNFDLIEAVGVLHHLADPLGGWRSLLSLLRPNGEMRVGLYSEAARRAVVAARELIVARGYHATHDDIRKLRQEIFRDSGDRWQWITSSADFYSISGCRDLLFNVMEHRFTLPQIKAFLVQEGLSFLGFDGDPKVRERFQRKFPQPAALLDLDCWHAFEIENPLTFRQMYVFSVRRLRN